MSRAKTAVVVLVAFICGYAVHFVVLLLGTATTHPTSIAGHWKLVKDYKAYMNDPANQRDDLAPGLIGVVPPYNHEPSLAALVSAGELQHVALVLPLVPKSREANLYFIKFVIEHDDIIEASANPQYVAYKPTGEQPMHMQLWFKDSAESHVQRLINDRDYDA